MSGPKPRELAELERVLATLRAAEAHRSSRGFVAHKPHPKQAEFLALDCREALYGGAAGGGKSDALLMGALQHVHVPGYAALILRRTFRDLNQADAIMARSHAWLGGRDDVTWNDRDKRWTFPSGATLTFGYLDTDKDKYQYQGAALQYVGWDELTQFPEQPYRYLFSRLRRLAGVDVPLRVRAATNPGGIGHEWVRRRFIETADPSRPFIPALLSDNPSIDQAAYLESLAELDATTRAQLERGVWVRDTDGLVYHYDEGRNTVERAPACTRKILALDFGATAPTSFSILGWVEHERTVYVLRSWKRSNLSPSEAADEIHRLDAEHRFEAIVGDIGGLGKGYQLEARRRFQVPIEAAEKNNKLGYIALFNGDLERGLVKVIRDECSDLVTEWSELPWDEKRAKEATGFDNHCADGVLYGWRRCAAFLEEATPALRTRVQAEAEQERLLEDAEEEAAERQRSAEWWA